MKNLLFISFLFLALSTQAQIIANDVNLFLQRNQDISWKTSRQIHQENLETYKKFLESNVDKYVDYEKAKYLLPSTAEETLQRLRDNPVVSMYSSLKYDPQRLGIGFCFGRAMFVHLELVQRGLDRDSIKKAFVVGSMQTDDGKSWGWHVTAIAQTKDSLGNKKWLALDPITGAVDVEAWYNIMRNDYSTDKKLKLYITENTRLGMNGVYDEDVIRRPFYNQYFTDMMSWFENESVNTNFYSQPIVGIPDENCDKVLMQKTPVITHPLKKPGILEKLWREWFSVVTS